MKRIGLELCRFLGAAAQDDTAEAYAKELCRHHVEPCLVTSASDTGPSAVSLCLITPGGQRTMRTCLGASAHLDGSRLPLNAIEACSMLHCEGYALLKPDPLRKAVAAAKAGGAQVSLDLASFEVVRACLPTLVSLLKDGSIDIIFGNEDEIEELKKMSALEALSGDALYHASPLHRTSEPFACAIVLHRDCVCRNGRP
jgi:sugar/nucleoside kinase (ribokinase family)